jgi:predicted restriction endonuclease
MRKPRIETKPRKTRLTCENAHLTRDKQWLEARYFDNNLSLAKIAKLIPCSTRNIHKCFVRLEIPFKPKHITYGEINRPDYRGDKNPHWQPNKAKCSDCNEILKNSQAIRCHSCHVVFNRGENHPSWKPPEQRVGTETEIIRNSGEYKEWRIKVWSRDKTKCRVCGIRKDPMIAHHLDGFNIFPEKRFDVDNGVTLCDKHHIAFHTNYGFGNNTKSQFEEYLATTTEMTY